MPCAFIALLVVGWLLVVSLLVGCWLFHWLFHWLLVVYQITWAIRLLSSRLVSLS